MTELEARIVKLEKASRQLRTAIISLAVLAFALMAAFGGCGASNDKQTGAPETMKVRELQADKIQAGSVVLKPTPDQLSHGQPTTDSLVLGPGMIICRSAAYHIFLTTCPITSSGGCGLFLSRNDAASGSIPVMSAVYGGDDADDQLGSFMLFNGHGKRVVVIESLPTTDNGSIRIFNGFEKEVVTIQGSKSNNGLVAVRDFDGSFVQGMLGSDDR